VCSSDLTRGGYSFDRRGYRGPDAHELWTMDMPSGDFTQLTTWTGNDGMGKWAENNRLVFVSDRDFNTDNLFLMNTSKGADNEKNAKRLTAFEGDDIEAFDVSHDGSTCVFVAWDRLYTIDLTKNNARPVEISVRASQDESTGFELIDIEKRVSEAALSPDGKTMAIVAYGEIFIRGTEEDSPHRRVTFGESNDREIAWSPDGETLYFTSDRAGTDSIYATTVTLTRSEIKEQFKEATNPPEPEPEADEEADDNDDAESSEDDAVKTPEEDSEDAETDGDKEEDGEEEDEKEEKTDLGKRWVDAVEFDIAPVVATSFNDRLPMPSPDGKHLAFYRTRGDIMLKNIETGEVTTFMESWDFFGEMTWSPDGSMIAWVVQDRDFNSDIWIGPADDASLAVNVTRHPDTESEPRFSADGKVLYFLSERRGDEQDVWRVYLDPALESFRGKELENYYKDAAKAAKEREPLDTSEKDDKEDEKKDSNDEPAFTLEDIADEIGRAHV